MKIDMAVLSGRQRYWATFWLCVMSLLPGVGFSSTLLALSSDAATPVSAEEIVQTASGIQIHIQERALRDVLQRIQNASQVQFEVSASLLEQPVSANLTASSWSEAIQLLLKNYNHIDIYKKDQQRLQRVYIMESVRAEDIPPIDMTHARVRERGPAAKATPSGRNRRVRSEKHKARTGSSSLPISALPGHEAWSGGEQPPLRESPPSMGKRQPLPQEFEVVDQSLPLEDEGPPLDRYLPMDAGPPQDQHTAVDAGPPREESVPYGGGPPAGYLPDSTGPPLELLSPTDEDGPPGNMQ